MTLNEHIEWLKELQELGLGEYKLYILDDPDGNGVSEMNDYACPILIENSQIQRFLDPNSTTYPFNPNGILV